jgi:hypothetical protein
MPCPFLLTLRPNNAVTTPRLEERLQTNSEKEGSSRQQKTGNGRVLKVTILSLGPSNTLTYTTRPMRNNKVLVLLLKWPVGEDDVVVVVEEAIKSRGISYTKMVHIVLD